MILTIDWICSIIYKHWDSKCIHCIFILLIFSVIITFYIKIKSWVQCLQSLSSARYPSSQKSYVNKRKISWISSIIITNRFIIVSIILTRIGILINIYGQTRLWRIDSCFIDQRFIRFWMLHFFVYSEYGSLQIWISQFWDQSRIHIFYQSSEYVF